MPPDEVSAHWLQFAGDDLKASRAMVREGLFHLACFHAQQAAEKALKGFLAARQKMAPREHHLIPLLHLSVRAGLRGSTLERGCRILDQYYLPTRYPDAVVGGLPRGLPSSVHADEAIRLAVAIVRAVKRSVQKRA